MEILLTRKQITRISTIGVVAVNGQRECFVLEDTDRGLRQDMRPDEIAKIKVYGQTAIPKGRYSIAITYSERFKQYLPLLLNVPGYEGVRIHPGNTAENTLGCLLPGTDAGDNMVMNSKMAFRLLFAKMRAAEKFEKIYITIQ